MLWLLTCGEPFEACTPVTAVSAVQRNTEPSLAFHES